jgi:NDP-sugar pyrophosphorylase family protein
MNKVHIVIPCGGAGSRFKQNDVSIPKPLIDLYGKPFFWWAAQSAIRAFPMKDLTFIVLEEHIEEYKIVAEIKKYFPEAKISVLPYQLNGPVFTAISGISQFADGDPIVFQDCDHAMSCNEFEIPDDCEGAIMSFKSREPQFGYIKYIGGRDTQYAGTVEKNPVSNHAIFGCYYFKNAEVFAKAAVLYFNDGTQKEFYMSGLYNYLLNVKRIDVKDHFEFGTPDELKELKSEVSEDELKGKLGL